MNLTETLHDKFLSCGEIISGKHLAEIILDTEIRNNVTYSTAEIRQAIWHASDGFVDSMQTNAYHTLQENRVMYGKMEYEAECAFYEKQRPANVRLAALQTILSA